MKSQHNEERQGDSNAITRKYLDSLLIETRYIDSVIPDTGFELFGESFASPIMTSAFSHLDHIYGECNNGMVLMAKGAHAAKAVMWAGMGDDEEMKDMAQTGAKIIKIIKPYADEAQIFHQIDVAEQYGAIGVGMDIDHSFDKKGEFDCIFGEKMESKTVEQLHKYASYTKLPFIVKGVLSVQDTKKCLEAKVGGILVSHHHGICDYCVPPLMVLPEIAKEVNKRIPIFVDCGINRGFDAFKALALGADGVCVGRTIIDNLVKAGHMGVKEKFDRMNAELREIMARTGARDIRHIDESVIWNRRD